MSSLLVLTCLFVHCVNFFSFLVFWYTKRLSSSCENTCDKLVSFLDDSNLFWFSLKVRVIGSQLYKIKSKASYLINIFHLSLKSILKFELFVWLKFQLCFFNITMLPWREAVVRAWVDTGYHVIVSTQAHNNCPIRLSTSVSVIAVGI